MVDLEHAIAALGAWTGQGVGLLPSLAPEDKLRISVTAACNYSCYFCHNEGALPVPLTRRPALSPSDVGLVASSATAAGVRSIVITGGEPLTYSRDGEGISAVVAKVANAIAPYGADLSVTTNGQLLDGHAHALREAGLNRVTVSMHTADRDTFRREISQSGSPQAQLRGIEAAAAQGLAVKANVVVVRENLDEIPSLVQKLADGGVETVRLYRLLWAPLAAERVPSSRVTDGELVDLALGVSGVVVNGATRQALYRVLRMGSGSERSVFFSNGTTKISLDIMPSAGHGDGVEDEGRYSLRLTSEGRLKTRLFNDEADLAAQIAAQDQQRMTAAFLHARQQLAS